MKIGNVKLEILEQNAEAYENAKIKNRFIQSTDAEWLGFVDGEVTSKQEITQLLEENPVLMEYDVILFGKDVPEGECGFLARTMIHGIATSLRSSQ